MKVCLSGAQCLNPLKQVNDFQLNLLLNTLVDLNVGLNPLKQVNDFQFMEV